MGLCELIFVYNFAGGVCFALELPQDFISIYFFFFILSPAHCAHEGFTGGGDHHRPGGGVRVCYINPPGAVRGGGASSECVPLSRVEAERRRRRRDVERASARRPRPASV